MKMLKRLGFLCLVLAICSFAFAEEIKSLVTASELRTWPSIEGTAKRISMITGVVTLENPDKLGKVQKVRIYVNLVTNKLIAWEYIYNYEPYAFKYDNELKTTTNIPYSEKEREACLRCHKPKDDVI